MRVPLSWLREYVDFDWSPDELARRLTLLGMEVQSVEQVGGDWQGVVVGELLDVTRHPRSEKLSLTSVRVAPDQAPLSIVCGATNIAVGQRVPVALPGSVLPGGRRIGVSAIAGANSEGMLCSGAELGLTADADGILILAESSADGNAPQVGVRLEQVVGDTVIDVDVKPNRGDALSLIGLAREVAAITGGQVRWPAITVPESGDATTDHLSVEIADPQLCSRFVGRWVDGIKIGPSPLNVQLRLTAAGMRPVSNVVDASNYVMLELGKPIHIFDAAVVDAGRIVVRRAHAGETLETLDHVERQLTDDTLLIADETKPLGIAGVMGGAGSEVSESTSAVIIESAIFDPVSIRRTAHRYSLRSEASLRFEKGQESRLARLGADRTAQLIAQWAAGRVCRGVIDTNPVDEPPRRVTFRPARVNRLLGETIPATEMRALLARVEIATEPAMEGDDAALVAIVPPHRRDIVIEPDVSEEIARVRGYETITPRLPDTPSPPYRADPRRYVDELRDLLSARGVNEVLTHALTSPEEHARLGIAPTDPQTIRISNPVAADHDELRRSLLPGLLRAVAANERQRRPDIAIFEIGAVHSFAGGDPVQTQMLGIMFAGNLPVPSWSAPARAADVADAKGLIEWLAARLHAGAVEFSRTSVVAGVEHPGRTAAVRLAGRTEPIGRVGELAPRYLHSSDVRAERVVFATIELEALVAHAGDQPRELPLARLPVVERDVAVVVSDDVEQAAVASVIRAAAGEQLVNFALFDRYQGRPLGEDEVSLAYRLRFQPTDRQMTDAELEEIVHRVGSELGRSLGARIRGPEETA